MDNGRRSGKSICDLREGTNVHFTVCHVRQLELDKGARSTLNLEGRNGTKGGLEKKERQAKVAPPSVNEPLAPSSLHHPPREIRLRASLAIF